MEKILALLLFTFIFSFFTHLCEAQAQPLTRQQLENYTNSTIYQNPTHSITGQSLQNTFANFNNSCANLRTDTMIVMLFDSNYAYYFGMKVLIPDTLLGKSVSNPPQNPHKLSAKSYLPFPYQGIMRCDTAYFKGPFDTIHFKPVLYSNWNDY
jgi:hypothetical protein